jgi:hypothetical protein
VAKKKIMDGTHKGMLASRSSASDAFTLDPKNIGPLMKEIDAEFSSVTFENTLSKLLIMFNQKLDNQ